MVTAVLPRFFVGKQTSQPQGSRVIDWSNPITRGLIGAFLPESPINFVDGEQMYQDWLPPTQSVKAQSEGKVLKNGMYTYQSPNLIVPYGFRFDLTTGAALIVASQSSAQNSNIGIGRAETSGSQFWGIGLHGGSANGAYGTWGTFSFTPSTSGVSTLQKRTVIINADGSTATLYMDGGVVSSGAYTMPAYNSGFRNRCFAFGSTTAGQNSNAATIETSLGFVWNRPLSEQEVAQLSANPWQIFRRAQQAYTPLFDSTPSPTSRTFFIPSKKVMSSQPQGNIQINWDNPITRGLACVYIPQISPQKPIDPVSGAVAVNNFIATRLPDVLPANGGSALVTNSITGDARWGFAFDIPNAPAGRTGYPVLSIFSRCEILNTTGEGTIWGAGQSFSPSSDIVIALRFYKINDRIDLIPSSNAGGTITGPTFSTNRVYNLGGIQRFTNNFRAYYIDGALYNSNTSNFNNLNSGFQAGSAYKLNATSFQSKIYCGYVWQRELTAAEMQSLSDNPWQIFKQPRLSPALAEEGQVYASFTS